MDNVELMKKHLADYSASRWDDYRAVLAKDVRYEEIATRTTAQGADDYLAAVKRWKKPFPDNMAKVLDVFASGDRVTAEVEWQGTHTGPFDGPFGTIAPTNQRGTLRAVLISRIENGKIVEVHHYFDVITLLAQMGAIPNLVKPVPQGKPVATPPPH